MKIFKKILVILGWLCLVGVVGFTIYYANAQREEVRCKSIVVFISPNSPLFFNEEEISDMIEKSGEPIVGHRLSDINWRIPATSL